MSKQYPGGLITKTPVVPSGAYETSTASGIWTLDQQAAYAKLGQWPTAGNIQPDAQFNYVTMLLHGDGTNGAQNNTFLDTSGNSYTITRNGNTTQGSFSPYGSGWSMYGVSSSGITANFWPSGALVGTGGTFSTEFFFLGQSNSTGWMLGMSADNSPSGFQKMGPGVAFSGTGNITVYLINTGGTTAYQSTATAYLAGQWNHIAIVRTGGTLAWWLNGTRGASVSNSTNIDAYRGVLGSVYVDNPTRDSMTNCYISNFRASNSVAYYSPSSSTITVPTAPFTAASGTTLITCQSNRFIDTSGSNTTISVAGDSLSIQRFNPFGTTTAYSTSVVGGSGSFDGTGDTLSLPGSTFTVTTGDYTVECWAYANSLATTFYDKRIWCVGDSLGNDFELRIGASGSLYFSVNDGGQISASGYKTGIWYHFVLSRVSGTVRLFTDGVLTGSSSAASVSASLAPQFATTFMIGGASFDSSTHWNGYITGFKFTNGSGVTSVTVPTAPVTGGTLLLGMTNGAIFDNAMMNDLETVGNAQISTSVKKYGTGSLAFDGTGDYLFGGNYLSATFGTGDFTIEMWLYYSSSAAGSDFLIDCRPAATNGAYPTIYADTGILYYFANSGTRITSSSISTNTWMHVAVCRSGTSTKMFINGTQTGSTYTDSTNYICRTDGPVIGADRNFGDSLLGYIDDFRITKGYARYTATFTPPTAAFPNIGPT